MPGLIDYAVAENSLIAGDDFKSGQTKMKSVLVDFLVGAGIKPTSIVSYNHLGNNDGMNLSAPSQFRSKEISKSNVVDDMVASNSILYGPGEHPDHVVVIKVGYWLVKDLVPNLVPGLVGCGLFWALVKHEVRPRGAAGPRGGHQGRLLAG